MTVRIPSTSTVMNDADCVPPSSIGSTGVGVGVGSKPGDSPGPADTDSATAQTSTNATNNLLIDDSPLVSVRADIARKLSEDFTSSEYLQPHRDEADGLDDARGLFVRLYREGRLDEAHALCSNRAASLASTDYEGRAVWACNFAILRRDAGDCGLALALLNLVAPYMRLCSPLTRAKYHNGLGRTYELLGDAARAVAEYETAALLYTLAERRGDVAIPLLNIGRVKASEGLVDEARAYLRRAARIATESGDFRLLGEIAEEGAKL